MVALDERINENSVYVTLMRMIARGYVSCREETAAEQKKQNRRGPKRRLYKLEPFGKQQYDARIAAERAAERVIVRGGLVKPEGAM